MNEAELLFTEVLQCQRADLFLDRSEPLSREQGSRIARVLKRRILGQPLAYILAKTEFMGLEFKVTPDVLIPRPETEILAETAIRYSARATPGPIGWAVARSCAQGHKGKILELGTGSGCIAVSLAKSLPEAEITATDISEMALKIAQENARLHNTRIHFSQGDLFSAYSLKLTAYSLIVCNPPYIPTADIDRLQPEISYEPRIALDGGNDGLSFYRRIIAGAPAHLEKNGFLILEIGYHQLNPVRGLLKKSGSLEIAEIVRDYSDIDRVIVAKKYCS